MSHEPKDFRRGLWFKEKCMFNETSEAGIACRCTGPEDKIIERTWIMSLLGKLAEQKQEYGSGDDVESNCAKRFSP